MMSYIQDIRCYCCCSVLYILKREKMELVLVFMKHAKMLSSKLAHRFESNGTAYLDT